MLVENACLTYLEAKSKRVRANTLEGYESAIRVHILPAFGGREVESLAHDEVQAWVDGFELPGAAAKAYKTLRQVVRWCLARQLIRIWDYTIGIELPKAPRYEPRPLDASQTAELQRGMHGAPPELEAYVLLSSTLGLRPGEAANVDIQRDVDYRSGEVRITGSLQVVGGETVYFPPKTERSRRKCYLPRYALVRLRQLRSLLSGRLGEMCRPDRLRARVRAWCKRHALPFVHCRELRHTWASNAVEAGVPIETVAMMLGHTDIGTAYAHYIRPRKAVCQEAQRMVERLVLGAAG